MQAKVRRSGRHVLTYGVHRCSTDAVTLRIVSPGDVGEPVRPQAHASSHHRPSFRPPSSDFRSPLCQEHTADLDALLRLCCQLQGKLQLEPLLLLAERLAGYAAAAGVDVAATEGLPAPPPLSAANAVRVQGRA